MFAREGDLIKTVDNVIFDVKGLVHPPDKIVAFPRYIPSVEGSRGSQGELYCKVYNLAERFRFLEQKAPWLIVDDPVFGDKLCEVPHDLVKLRFDPIKRLDELRKSGDLADLERRAVEFAEALKEQANIPWGCLGISGSVMAGLFTVHSDIDPLVYGVENCRLAYAALQELLGEGDLGFKGYSRGELEGLFDFRSKDTLMGFEDFVRVEKRKAFQGKFMGTDFFVRFVKDWDENFESYGDVCYRTVGYVKVEGVVVDDVWGLFTPCSYRVEDVKVLEGEDFVPIEEIVSFRGRFCEQAKTGEKVVAQGKVEQVSDKRLGRQYFRVLVGNRPSDFMMLL
jgi:predicted nucleotidyltransferase